MDAFDDAVDRLRRLPGIGEKSARRLVFHLLSISDNEVEALANSLVDVTKKLGFCTRCYGLAQEQLCEICRDRERDRNFLCLVAHPEDVFTIEKSGNYNGLYHVLRGLISPLEGVGPEQLTIDSLVQRITNDSETIDEIIFAFNPTNEGEVTMNYLQEKMESYEIEMSHLGYGLPVGSDIEYTDQMTLSRAFDNRVNLEEETSTP